MSQSSLSHSIGYEVETQTQFETIIFVNSNYIFNSLKLYSCVAENTTLCFQLEFFSDSLGNGFFPFSFPNSSNITLVGEFNLMTQRITYCDVYALNNEFVGFEICLKSQLDNSTNCSQFGAISSDYLVKRIKPEQGYIVSGVYGAYNNLTESFAINKIGFITELLPQVTTVSLTTTTTILPKTTTITAQISEGNYDYFLLYLDL